MQQISRFVFFLLSICTYAFSHSKPNTFLQKETTPIVQYLRQINITEANSNLEGIDCIYVINLDDRPQKWARVKALFNERNMKVNRVSGIYGAKLSTEAKKQLQGPYAPTLGSGHIGCFLSHVSIMKHAYEKGYNVIWVMEDDVDFKENVQQIPKLIKSLSQIDPDWDTFYTDVNSKNNKGEPIPSLMLTPRPDQRLKPLATYIARIQKTPDIMKIGQRFGMYSVLISKKGLKKMVDYFTHVYLYMPIDADIHYIPTIREYSTTREIVTHWTGNSFSDTAN